MRPVDADGTKSRPQAPIDGSRPQFLGPHIELHASSSLFGCFAFLGHSDLWGGELLSRGKAYDRWCGFYNLLRCGLLAGPDNPQ